MAGLTLPNGINFADYVKGDKKPHWLDYGKGLAAITDNNVFVNFVSGLSNLQNFLFRTPKWPIGGLYFDGIMKTDHVRRVRATQHPVQTGVTMTDHAIIESAELSIEIFMSDANSDAPFATGSVFLDQAIRIVRNNLPDKGFLGEGEGRSINAWLALKALQMACLPITVETRLDTYENMLIEELSAPDDVKTLYALKATIRSREIMVAQVGEVAVSARPHTTEQTNLGEVKVTSLGSIPDKSAAKVIDDKIFRGKK